jgi:hypothetical protein
LARYLVDIPSDPPGRSLIIPLYSLRLRDLLSAKGDLIVRCGACRRASTVDPIDLVGRRRLDFFVKDLERGLRCDVCGNAGWASIRVEWR